ncbi:hypothetical protein FRC09_014545 [Ceratobasidium sp. 395]|nr:hypothetical protein FRC09_014545 [Ceratobasidium sp. 395]
MPSSPSNLLLVMEAIFLCQRLGFTLLAYSYYAAGQNPIRVDDSSVYSLTNPTGIQFTPGDWSTVTGGDASSRYQGTFTQSKNGAGMIFLAFRGSSIGYYTDKGPGSGNVSISLDGSPFTNVSWTDIGPNVEYQQQMWSSGPIIPGDHQVTLGNFDRNDRSIGLDYFAVTPLDGSTGITPQRFGPGASEVPPNAVIVDDRSDAISYSGVSWGYQTSGPSQDVQGLFFNNTETWSDTPGSSCSFTFNGTGVWYFGDYYPRNSKVDISIDGGEAHTVDTRASENAWVTQSLYWGTSGLTSERHTITVTHAGAQGDYITLDYFMYLPSPNSPSVTSSPTPTSVVSDVSSPSVPVAAIAGGVAGGVALLATLIGLLVFFRKRRSHQATAETETQHGTYVGSSAYHKKEFDPTQLDDPTNGPVMQYRGDSPYTNRGSQARTQSMAPTTWTGATAYNGLPELQ